MTAVADTDRLLTTLAAGRPAPAGDTLAALLAAWREEIWAATPMTDAAGLEVGEPSPGRVTYPADGCAFCAFVGHTDYAVGSDAADLRPDGATSQETTMTAVTGPLPRVRVTLTQPASPPRVHPDYRALFDEPPPEEPRPGADAYVTVVLALTVALALVFALVLAVGGLS